MNFFFLFIFGLSAFAKSLPAKASFECSRAKTQIEKSICADVTLARLDFEVAGAYQDEIKLAKRYQDPENKKDLKESDEFRDQKAWLKLRDECLTSTDLAVCLRENYQRRLREMAFRDAGEQGFQDDEVLEKRNDARLAFLNSLYASRAHEFFKDEDPTACSYVVDDPAKAEEAMRSHFGGNRDNFYPLCSVNLEARVPALKPFMETVHAMSGDSVCDGTMRFALGRDRMMEEALGLLAPRYLFRDQSSSDVPTDKESRTYRPDLVHWSEQGIFERETYKKFLAQVVSAREAYRAYYEEKLKLPPAEARRFALAQISDVVEKGFSAHSGNSSLTSYPSGCYESRDVEAFLKMKQLPAMDCDYSEFTDRRRPSLLRKLLGIAIVTGRSVSDIETIIKAGAELDPAAALKPPLKSPSKTSEEDEEDARGELEYDSPLMMAADRSDVMKLLVKYGALVNRANRFGKTALMYAVQANNLSGVQTLLDAKADVESVTNSETRRCDLLAGHRTALMYAAWHSTPGVVDRLLKAGALPSTKDSEGKRAVDYLAKNDRASKAEIANMRTRLTLPSKSVR